MNKLVLIYTQEGCPHCTELKEMLDNNSIKYYVRDIIKHEAEFEDIVKITKEDYIPTVCVLDVKKETGVYLAPDRDFQDIRECLDKVKKIII